LNPLSGLGSGKSEQIGAYEADVYLITGIKVKTLVRSENMINSKREVTDLDKVEEMIEESEGKEEELLEKVQKFEVGKKDADLEKMITDARARVLKFKESLPPPPAPTISFDQYFQPETLKRSNSSSISLASFTKTLGFDKDEPEDEPGLLFLGREVSLTSTKREFKANVWMSNSFPLFVEQLLPIIEILAPSNRHFETLKEFIDGRLPRGFPIKIGE